MELRADEVEDLTLTDLVALLATTITSATAAVLHLKKRHDMHQMTDEEFWQSENDIVRRRVSAIPEVMQVNIEGVEHRVERLEKEIEELRSWLMSNKLQSK